jgi:serine/threonine protein kinase
MLVIGINNKIADIIKQFDKTKFDNLLKKHSKNKNKDDLISEYILAMPCVKEYLEDNSDTDSYTNTEEYQNQENNKITIKLSDFGSHMKIDKIHHSIQTIYYRAPEAILMYNINEKCDSWSIGCTLYELLTGKLLFDPNKTDYLSRDRHHIRDMYTLLGPISKELLVGSKKYKYFYTVDGLLKGIDSIKYIGLSNLILNDLKHRKDIDNDQLNYIIDFLYKLLKYDPNERLSFKECMDHPFLK